MQLRTIKSIRLVALATVFAAGCSEREPVTGPQHTILVAPARVVSLSASVVNENDIRLAWVAGDGSATSFEIEREEQHNPDLWVWVATVGGTDSTYHDTSASPLPVYQYRIRACTSGECSRVRLSRRVSSASVPAAPTTVETFDGGGSTRHVQWNDNSANENRFEIQRMGSSADGVWEDLPIGAIDQESMVDIGFAQFDNYVYRVRACHYFVGCSAWAYSAPTDPVDVSIVNASAAWNGTNEILLAWESGADNGVHTILRRTLPDGAWQSVGTTGTSDFADAVPVSGGFYQYRIRTCFLAVCASATATASVRPETPTGFASSGSTATTIDLMWDAMDNETEFHIQRRVRHPGFDFTIWARVASPFGDSTTYTDVTAITAGAQHQYRIRACNPIGCSQWSTAIQVTP